MKSLGKFSVNVSLQSAQLLIARGFQWGSSPTKYLHINGNETQHMSGRRGGPGTARVFSGGTRSFGSFGGRRSFGGFRGSGSPFRSSFRSSPFRGTSFRSTPFRSYQPYLSSFGYRYNYPCSYNYPYSFYNNYYPYYDYGLWPSTYTTGVRGALILPNNNCIETVSTDPAVIGRPFFAGQTCAGLAVQAAQNQLLPAPLVAQTPAALEGANVLAVTMDNQDSQGQRFARQRNQTSDQGDTLPSK